jgi:filamentous hemagglutinin family protein
MRKRVRAAGAVRPEFSAKPPAVNPGNPRSCRAWISDLQSGTAFAALFAIGLIGAVPAAHAQEPILPTGGTVTHGNATISGGGNGLLIDQTSGSAIINWNTFSIGPGGTTHFNNGAGATLNRVTGNVSSQIDGSLTATGSLFLVNPAGVVVGTGGMVATGGTFAASTQDVSDADFLDGGSTIFAGESKAQIVNHGTISSAMGDVALIARRVENTGDISAPNGTAALLAGYDILMHETVGPNGKFAVRVGGADTEAVNSGTINAAEVELRANGGNVLALAGNTKGVVKATGVSKRGGRIFLTAGGGKVQAGGRISARRRVSSGGSAESGGDVFINADTVVASGNIDVSGFEAAGGSIDIGGRDIALTGATLDASGTTGGGRIRVGGEYQGGKGLPTDEVENADTLLIDALSVLRADGTGEDADGGTVIAWSDGTTTFDGRISVRAAAAGNGGFVETSGAYLGLGGRVDVASALGESGTWLIDPVDVTVDAVLIASILPTLEAGGNITVTTNNPGGDAGDISLVSALTVDFANDASADNEATITAFADNSITVSAPITALNGVLNLDATAQNSVTIGAAIDTNGGDIEVVSGDTIFVVSGIGAVSSNGGDITFRADNYSLNAAVNAGAGTIMFDRVTTGNLGLGFNAGAAVASLNSAELGLLSAGSLIIGDPTAAQNNINQLDLQSTFDLSGNIAGLVQLNALSSAAAFMTSLGSQTYRSVEYNANDGVTFTADQTVTTTVGDAIFNVDADSTSTGSAGFNDLRAQDGDVTITSAGNLLVTTQRLAETGTGTLDLNAAGNISVARSTSGAIGVGDGASGGLSISDAQLGVMSAASLTIGDTTNTTTINVDGISIAGLGALALNTTNAGTVNLADSAEAYTFQSLTVNSGTANLGASITSMGAQTFNTAVNLAGDTILTTTTGANIDFNGTIDGAHGLTVNNEGTTTFNGAIGGTTALTSLTTNDPSFAIGKAVMNGKTITLAGNSATFNNAVVLNDDLEIVDTGNVAFLGTVDSGVNGAKSLTVTTAGKVFLSSGVGFSSPLDSLAVTGSQIGIGDSIETLHAQTFNGPTVLNGAIIFTATDAGGDISFLGTVDSYDTNQFLKANAAGDITFGGKVGGSTLVSLLEATAGGTIFVNGGLVATKGSQTYYDQVSVAGTVFVSTGGELIFNAGVTPVDPSKDVWFLAADDITIGGDIQWGGSGSVTLVAGWNAATDGSTGWTLGGTTADTPTLITAGNYGLGVGDVSISDGTKAVPVAVGSSGGTTTALARDLLLNGGNIAGASSQLGFRGAATGDIDVKLTRNLSAQGGGNSATYVQVGHGGYNQDQDHSGNITVETAGDVTFTAGDVFATYAQLGHGGYVADGNNSGAIVVSADSLTFTGGGADSTNAQLGHGGRAGNGSHSGSITITAVNDLTFTGGSGSVSYAQLGHGGFFVDDNHSGAITINSADNMALSGGSGIFSFAQMGHGGAFSSGDHSGDISLNLAGGLSLTGGSDADAYAQIGHGDASGNASGSPMGDISAIVGGQTNFSAGTGGYWLGHATTTDGGISNADVALVTNGLSFAGLTAATGPTANSGDFTAMVHNNLRGGDVLIANRLAQIADADSGNPSYLDDIVYFGRDSSDEEVETDHSLFFAATGEVSFEFGLQMNGSGNINLVAGWDGTTGLDLTGFPMLSMADIETAGAFGSSTGAEGDNGDINIREFNPVLDIAVGTWMGNIHALAHDLEVTGGPTDFAASRLGARPQASTNVDGDIRIAVKDDVLVLGGDGEFSSAAIGHAYGDGFGDITGDITILGENDANDNEIVVAGGDAFFSVARIGHDAFEREANGDILIRGEDIIVEGGSQNDASAQIGHFAELANGGFDIEATGDLQVLGGTDDDAHAQIGHNGQTAAGNSLVSVGGDLAVVGGIDEFAFAQIGNIGEFASGSIEVGVAGLALMLGGFDEVADAQIGHDGETLASGAIDFTVGGPLIMAALDQDALAYVGHSGATAATGDINVDVGDSLIMGTLGDFTAAQIGHIADGANSGDTTVDVDGAIFLGNLTDGSYSKIGHGNWITDGALSGDIDITSTGPIMLYGGLLGTSFTQFGHGDPFGFSAGTRQGDITVVTDGEMTLDDGLSGGSLSWIGHGTGPAGVSNANVFLQAFGFDRDILSTVAAGDLGTINKDIIEADIPAGNFTIIATGTGIEFDDPAYNSPFRFLAQANNDIVLNTNATFTNSGTGDIILAAGGDFHNDTGSLTPFTTGGRWLVYSTRPDNNRNDVEVTNWDFLRYATTFDINNPHVGSGDGFVYSVAPVVNFFVSSHTINYGETFSPTIAQTLTVNGVQVDPNAFGLGINPATAQYALASFVTTDAAGNPLAGFYDDGLTTGNEFLPYFGMSFVTMPGDLTVTPLTTVVGGDNPIPTATNSGIGGMCAFRSDDEDPDEDGPSYDRIIELCGIVESDTD